VIHRIVRESVVLAVFLLVAQAGAAVAVEPRVAAVGLTVADLERSLGFFTGLLGFERRGGVVEASGPEFERLTGVFGARARTATVCLGAECLELVDFVAAEGEPYPPGTRSNDRWFQHVAIVVSDMAAAYARLVAAGVEHVSTAPQRLPDWNPNAGGIEAFYFRDRDGHALELIAFPPGKGDPRWQNADRLFLGIDHTAIAVADTESSLRFWRDALGLEVAGASENWGPEQERLNNVFAARLRITGLRAPGGGIGVEFLEYLSPSDGRDTPRRLATSDLAHWHVRLEVGDPEAEAVDALRGGGRWVSPGSVELVDGGLGYRRGALVRDADGHGVLLSAD
jgi:catechol 2,3-dioxygenase-like lactoylglutathione lyase family enzyme